MTQTEIIGATLEGSQMIMRNVNGTEGNGTGESEFKPGVNIPIPKILDKSGFLRSDPTITLQRQVSLSETTYVAGSTEVDGIATGWKLLRDPQ